MADFSRFLDGITVLDLSQYLPGPMATLFLADMGARVIKVEPPQGDPMQDAGPRDRQGRPVFYHTVNGGKTVVRLNLKSDPDRERFFALLEDADVVVEGFRPGVLDRLGIGYPKLQARKPGMILCSISGYGAGTEYASAAGHDGNYLAISGAMARNGDGAAFYDPPVADGAGALFAAMAILGALHGRDRGQGGCHIDLALADVTMPLQMMQVAGYGATGIVPRSETTYLNGGAAYYRTYATCDGHMMVGAIEPKFWRNFCEAADHPKWIARHADPLPQTLLISELSEWFAVRTREECEAIFAGRDCCVSPVLDLGEALAHDYTAERGLIRPDAEGVLHVAFPARVDGLLQPARHPPQFIDADHLDGSESPTPFPNTRKQEA